MSEIVFVLGAGASRHCGTPLMDNFLEVAQDLMRLGEVEIVREDFENVFDAIGNLHAIQSKANINTYNIEDVYAAFEMGKLLGRLPGIEEKNKLEKLASSIKKVISYTLEQTTKLPHNKAGHEKAPIAYNGLISIFHRLSLGKKSHSIITFNYDVGLDYSLYESKILPDYGLGDVDLTDKRYVTYLKLHGSLNWGKCKKCGKVTPCREFLETLYTPGRDYHIIPMISKLKSRRCSCGEPFEEDPFIVPPTWNKTAFHEQIEQVWEKAAHELRDAERIFVLGYSFPSSDLFFHYLFALGVDMKTLLRGFHVYNPDPNVKERFEDLLGSGIIEKFQYYGVKFEDAVQKEVPMHMEYVGLDTPLLSIPQILQIS